MKSKLFILFFFLPFIQLSAQTDTASGMLEEVVVTGQYAPQSLGKSVYNVRVIGQERIKMRASNNVLNILSNELGIRLSTDFTLGETDLQLMGIGGSRVKVLLDGVPMVDRDGTRQSLGQIDINNIERIEIVEGPMSVMYGTDAMAGVINLITKKGKGVKGFAITARVQEESMGKKYDAFTKKGIHTENLSATYRKKNWLFSAYATRNNQGGWTDSVAYPWEFSKPKDQWLGGANIGWQNTNINIWYKLDYAHENIFSAGTMNPLIYKGTDQYYITNRFTHQAQLDWKISGKVKLNSAVSYQDYKRNTESYNIDYIAKTKTPVDSALVKGAWDVSKFKTMFLRSTATWVVSPTLSFQPGIEVKTDRTSGQRISANATPITDYSAFASAEYQPYKWLSLRPGVRFSKNSKYDAPPVIPSLNTRFTLTPKLDMRLSYARGFRAPMLRELFFNFVDASHRILGNPNLKAEQSNSYYAAFTWQNKISTAAFKSTLAGFYNDYHDFIGTATDPVTNYDTYFNVSSYKTIGSTLENTFTTKQLTATLGLSYIGRYNSYSSDDKSLPEFVWAPELNSNITYAFTKLKVNIGVFYKFTGRRPSYQINSAGIYLARINAYHWADLTASKELFKVITLQGGIKNIFNVGRVGSSVESGGAHSTGGPVLTGYGRSFFGGILFNWHK